MTAGFTLVSARSLPSLEPSPRSVVMTSGIADARGVRSRVPRTCAPMALLEVENLRKTFRSGSGDVEAVRGISLKIEEGIVLGFLGPNGAGKTTTIKMIAGLVRPDSGSIRVAGLNPHDGPEALRHIGAVLEGNRNIYWRLTPLENLEYFGVLKGMAAKVARAKGREILERFGLAEKMKSPVQELSRGMQQKIAIAVALVHEPSLLLLDEPTLGLDVEAAAIARSPRPSCPARPRSPRDPPRYALPAKPTRPRAPAPTLA